MEPERLVFLGYPLHAPGRKDEVRDEALKQIKIPMLFFAGTRDTLCNLDSLKPVLEKIKSPWSLEVIEGGDHSFSVPKNCPTTQADVYRDITKKTAVWLTSRQMFWESSWNLSPGFRREPCEIW